MKRELFLVALFTACGGSPAVPDQPPPRPEPAPDEPTPVPEEDAGGPDASAPPEEVATEERDGDPRGDPLSSDSDAAVGPTLSNAGPGSLDPAIIHRVVRAHTGKIRYCYSKVLQTNPSANGKLSVKFIIGDTGTVTTAAIQRASGLPELDQCVAAVFFGMHFPAPVGGYVTVHYPFVFATS
jgi:outer membrane biosynthesis protein TonB